jgi:hypothetical protein
MMRSPGARALAALSVGACRWPIGDPTDGHLSGHRQRRGLVRHVRPFGAALSVNQRSCSCRLG